ncbi:hypothetical protein LZ30DRAFT_445971 [Colletotrichum cereale]|nr:hypothetical protein LZ30DRAFT_445971 [Colletotrichum cereale]
MLFWGPLGAVQAWINDRNARTAADLPTLASGASSFSVLRGTRHRRGHRPELDNPKYKSWDWLGAEFHHVRRHWRELLYYNPSPRTWKFFGRTTTVLKMLEPLFQLSPSQGCVLSTQLQRGSRGKPYPRNRPSRCRAGLSDDGGKSVCCDWKLVPNLTAQVQTGSAAMWEPFTG